MVVVLEIDAVLVAEYVGVTPAIPPTMTASKCVYPVLTIVAGYAVPTASTSVTRNVENHSYVCLLMKTPRISLV